MATTSNNNPSRPFLTVVYYRLRPRIAKISVEIILMIVLVAAIINGIMILNDMLNQHTALQHSIQQVNKTLAKMEKQITFNMTDVNTQIQHFKQELKEAEEKLGEFSKLSEAVKKLNKTVEDFIHHKFNSAESMFGAHSIVIVTILFSFYQQMHILCS